LGEVIRQTRDMIRYINTARDAVLLVRRASATEKLINEALRTCHQLEKQQFELRQDAAETHLRTQRQAGHLLGEVTKHQGGRPRKTQPTVELVTELPPTLRQLGIDRHESSRWQQIANLPPELFEAHISDCRRSGTELTTSGIILLAKRLSRDSNDVDGMNEDVDGLGERPSSGQALLIEYEKVKRHVSELMWLDPTPLAAVMSVDRRKEEKEHVQRMRTWFDEFEQALDRAQRS
jgi:hypothetical protein